MNLLVNRSKLFRTTKKFLVTSTLALVTLFAGECPVDTPNQLIISSVSINGTNLNLTDANAAQTDISLQPTVVITFDKALNLDDVKAKVKIATQDGNQNVEISIAKTHDSVFTVSLPAGASLNVNTDYLITIEKDLKATIDGTIYTLLQTRSLKFKTITQVSQNDDKSLVVEYNGNPILLNGTNFSITIPEGTNVNAVSIKLTVGIGAKLFHGTDETALTLDQNRSITRNFDFQNVNDFKVVAADGTEQTYQVTVAIQTSSSKDITTFVFSSENNDNLSVDVNSAIVENNITVTLPSGASKKELVPSISITGESVSPKSGVAADFTNDVVYTVTATDGSTQKYTVKVTIASADNFVITFFTGLEASDVEAQEVALGKKGSKPADPTRPGYVFDGWYKDKGFMDKFVFADEEITKHITIYAKWLSKNTSITSLTINGNEVTFTDHAATLSFTYGEDFPAAVGFTNLKIAAGAIAQDSNSTEKTLPTLKSADSLRAKDNALRIFVTGEDGTSKQIYTIKFTSAQPTLSFYTGTNELGQAITDKGLAQFNVVEVSKVASKEYKIKLGDSAHVKAASGGKFTITTNDIHNNIDKSLKDNDPMTISFGTSTPLTIAHYKPGNIHTWQDLQAMRMNLKGDYTLIKKITFPSLSTSGFPATGFEPIGQKDGKPFEGSLDGNSKEIVGLKILHYAKTNGDWWGLFGLVADSSDSQDKEMIKNLWLKDVEVKSSPNHNSPGNSVGSIAGILYAGKIINVGVIGKSSITSNGSGAGGLCGNINRGTLIGYSTADVTGNVHVGGLSGNCYAGTVIGYCTGNVVGVIYLGGLVGGLDRDADGPIPTVIGYYASGNITSTSVEQSIVGGLVGQYPRSLTATITGYMRGEVNRKSGDTEKSFGLLVGSKGGATVTGYHSQGEASATGFAVGETRTGVDGTPIITGDITEKSHLATFKFNDDYPSEPWVWRGAKKWPAIDFGDFHPPSEQPE